MSGAPIRRNAVPVTHELSRRAAAVGTALALVMLPFVGTISAADAASAPVPTASADSDPSAEAGSGSSPSLVVPDDDGNGNTDVDKACDPDQDPPAKKDEPCKTAKPLKAKWGVDKTLTIPTADMPESWENVVFKSKKKLLRVPAQDAPAKADSHSDTDDSGNPVPEAAASSVPSTLAFNSEGYLVDGADQTRKVTFQHDPDWKFEVDDNDEITIVGDPYDDSGDDDNASANTTGGSDDKDSTGSDGTSKDSDSAAGSKDKANADSSKSANSDSSSTSDDGSTSTSSNSDSKNSADSTSKGANSSDADSAKQSSNSDSSSKSDGSDSAGSDGSSSSGADSKNSDSKSSDSKSSADGKKSDSDKNGSGNSTGGDDGPKGKDTTPDPATGNGSSDTRDEIPGDAGDGWLPGGEGTAPPPDYSDPVPRNPDTPVPDNDTDLITGGDQPQPRADKPPSTSFGESIVSTIVSTWPVFVLAAFGMGAVGFIIYLVGRRNKQN